MGAIEPFLRARERGFDDDSTRVMGEAFDAACTALGDISKSDREAVADAIIVEAERGERDSIRLRDAGMAALEPKPR